MGVSLRRLAALGMVAALGLAAAPVKKITFTDNKLKNGLRVIISEDHSSPVFAVAVNYNVGSRDERNGPHRVRASLRTHDVQGLSERRRR